MCSAFVVFFVFVFSTCGPEDCLPLTRISEVTIMGVGCSRENTMLISRIPLEIREPKP